ncbi:DUF397 domain-containing protein [Streptomyces sp900105755]|uniref:DUF397 domain-containing protein n=1 Tax=Streptomyces sp. 900105755 TaxID=3154389 RepID=UPI00332B242A
MSSASTQWRRSSYSNGMGGECLEVAALAEEISVRDSKVALGPHIIMTRAAWRGFIKTLTPTHSRTAN